MTKLHDLFDDEGQSPWLDNIRRGWLTDGEMQTWIDQGIRGLTSNPSIFQKAIADSDDYDDQFGDLVRDDVGVTEAYWDLVITDIQAALDLLRPVHEASDGLDGYVSVEVDPGLARDTDGTIAAARELHTRIDQPNLYVKIPATAEGVPAIAQMIAEKRSINVTLIFSLERYAEVMEAYLSGLEAAEGDLAGVSSVASFFVSRVDTEVDRRLDEIGSADALALRGKTAIANARAAYRQFCSTFSGPRWEALAARGARPQRPLWASTSTKNDAYSDTLYIDELIGSDTVNTVPDATLDAFVDRGSVRRTIDAGDDPAEVLAAVSDAGVDLDDVTGLLEEQGVAAFEKSFDELLETLGAKADDLRSD